jgi:hypothetical protein
VNLQRGIPTADLQQPCGGRPYQRRSGQSLIEDSPLQAAENAFTFAVQNLTNKSHGSIYVKI